MADGILAAGGGESGIRTMRLSAWCLRCFSCSLSHTKRESTPKSCVRRPVVESWRPMKTKARTNAKRSLRRKRDACVACAGQGLRAGEASSYKGQDVARGGLFEPVVGVCGVDGGQVGL
eukprot:scaffold262092_cov27-Tisochrysis_lutea.AAC.1